MLRLSVALLLVQAGFYGFTVSIPLALAAAGRSDAEIGFVLGIAALVQIGAALAGGTLIDRVGAMRMFLIGGVCYGVACGLLLLAAPKLELVPLVVARVLQGTGTGLLVPSLLSVVPNLVSVRRRGLAIATAGASNNLTLVLLPPLSIVVLRSYGLPGVCVFAAVFVVLGLTLGLARPLTLRPAQASDLAVAARRFGVTFRSTWATPLVATILYVLHWGVLTAYLPQRAEAAGADIGLFFAADGVFVLLGRIPAGWIADWIRPALPAVVGIAMTAVALVLLFAQPSTPILVVSGALTGLGGALIVQPLMLALTNRSTDADRGSAFALFNAMFAAGTALGSIGTAPLVALLGFETLLGGAFVALVSSAFVIVSDAGLRRLPAPIRDGA